MHKNKPWRREAVITRKTWNQDSHLFSKLAISYKFPCKTKYGSPSPKIMEFEEIKASQFFLSNAQKCTSRFVKLMKMGFNHEESLEPTVAMFKIGLFPNKSGK